MFWNATNAWKDKVPKKVYAAPPTVSATKPVWSTMKILRPTTTGGERKMSRKQPIVLSLERRPDSAPALLTGDLVSNTHEDTFLQHLEDTEVRHIINCQRKEKLTKKFVAEARDFPSDPMLHHQQSEGSALYELGLWHSPCQRKHSAPAPKSKSDSFPCVDELHDISRTLDGNMRHHYFRLGLPRPVNPHFPKNAKKPAQTITEVEHPGVTRRKSIEFDTDKESLDFRAQFGALFRSANPEARRPSQKVLSSYQSRGRRGAAVTTRKTAPASLHQVALIMEEKYGSFRLAFKTFTKDPEHPEQLSLGDWEAVIAKIAPIVNAGDLFRHLNLGADDYVDLKAFEEVFHTQKYSSP